MALDYNLIGQRLKKIRLERNLTQEKLAEKANVSVAFLSRVERGSSHISLNRLTQLCDLLEISAGYILNGSASTSINYLNREFADLLRDCPPEKQKLIYNVAKSIIDTDMTRY